MANSDTAILICDGGGGANSVLYANQEMADRAARPLDMIIGNPVGRVLAAFDADETLLTDSSQSGDAMTAGGMTLQYAAAPPGSVPAIWIMQLAEAPGPDFVDRLPIGAVLFDAEDRLVWFNETYRGIIGPNAHLLKHGDTFKAIMTAAYRTGQYGGAGDVEDKIAERWAHHVNHDTFEEPLSSGRVLLTQEIATAAGGTLGVRTDITHLKTAG